MKAKVGSLVHPWYKGTHEWQVTGVAELEKPIRYADSTQGEVAYDPKIMFLESQKTGKVLWFPYWMATSKAQGKMRWGQRPSMLEESVFLELMKKAIKQGLFTNDFLIELNKQLMLTLKE